MITQWYAITYTRSKSDVRRSIFGGWNLPAKFHSRRAAEVEIAKHPMIFAGRNARVIKFKKGIDNPKRRIKKRK